MDHDIAGRGLKAEVMGQGQRSRLGRGRFDLDLQSRVVCI